MKKTFEMCYLHIAKATNEIELLSQEIAKIDNNTLWSLKEIPAPPFTDRSDWIIIVSALPSEMNVIAASANHNLRVPLDQMLSIHYSKFIATGPVPRQIYFPTAISAEAFNIRMRNLAGFGYSDRVLNYLNYLEPYPGGRGEDIFKIHAFDVASKHHGALTAKLTAAKVYFFNRGFFKGILYRIGQSNGPNLVNMNPGVPGHEHLQAPSDDLRPTVRELDGKLCIECEILRPELPIFRTSLAVDTVGVLEIVPALSIALVNGEIEEPEPVNFLKKASIEIEKVLDGFCELSPL